MGFFKSMRELQKEAAEIEKTMPPVGERARAATARMADLSQSMADQTKAMNAAAGGGVEATATVASARTVGMVNADPLLELDLTVMRDGMPPYPATVRQAIPQMNLARLSAGVSVPVKLDPDDPSAIWIDTSRIG